MENKYKNLIEDIIQLSDNFKLEERVNNPVNIKRENDNAIIIAINFSWIKSLDFIADTFKLTEAFGAIQIGWESIQQPKLSIFGTNLTALKLQWTFNNADDQKLIFKKIITDINDLYSSKKQERSYYKNALKNKEENIDESHVVFDNINGQNKDVQTPTGVKKIEVNSSFIKDSRKYTLELLLDELVQKGDLKKLLETSNKCIDWFPDWYYGYFNRGLVFIDSNELQNAVEDLDKTIELNPRFRNAFAERGYVRQLLKNYIGAIDDYMVLVKLDPKSSATAFYNIGVVKIEIKDYYGAIEFCNQAIELNPHLADSFCNRGVAKMELKNYDEAISDFNRAISIKPDYVDVYYNRGVCEMKLNNFKEAIENFSQVIIFNPTYFEAYSFRGVVRARLGEHEGAIDDFTKTIELIPNHADAYIDRGNSKQILGDISGACSDWRKAGDMGIHQGYDLFTRYQNKE